MNETAEAHGLSFLALFDTVQTVEVRASSGNVTKNLCKSQLGRPEDQAILRTSPPFLTFTYLLTQVLFLLLGRKSMFRSPL